MDVRLEKGRAIARELKIRSHGSSWLVPSQSGKGKGYIVSPTNGGFSCT